MSVDPAAVEQFGPYTVYERLGVGGMATVHRALEHAADGRDRVVALKRLLPHLAEDASFIKSFVREAKLASILNHLNIVQIYELGRVGTEYFISMEYIDGRDVRRLLRHARKVTGPPPIYVTIGVMIQLCEALDYAHNKMDDEGHPLGLVHRDISPSNLIVTSQGHLKVIDFGIAKAQSSQLRTQTGRVKGKLAYMAPEAISGSRDLDARSDIWAAGVILHELITARPLFASKNEYQTLLKVQKGDIIPPSTFNQACPPELDAIVAKALERDARQRFGSGAEMREELVALKKQYALQTGFRDLSSWIEWAFGLELPAGFSGDTSGVIAIGNTSRIHHSKTPRPPRDQEEDEAVDVVWGSGANESEEGPVLLEDVPDVSEKHHRPRRDTQDEAFQVDDIPTPLPSHGLMPSIYGRDPDVQVLPPTQPRLPPHTIEPALARGTDKPSGKPRSGVQSVVVPPPGKPASSAAVIPPLSARTKAPTGALGALPVVKAATTTGALPVVRTQRATGAPMPLQRQSDRMPAEPPRSSEQMPATGVPRASDRMPASAPIHVDAPQFGDRMAAQRARDTGAHATIPQGMRADTIANVDSDGPDSNVFTEDPETHAYVRDPEEPAANETLVARPVLSEEELFGEDAADVLRGVSAQMEAMATHAAMARHDELAPITRPEARPLAPLPSVPVVRFSKQLSIPPVNESAGLAHNTLRPVPQTKPGVAPAVLPRTGPNRPPAHASTPPVNVPTISRNPKRTWLFVLGGLLIAGGTATIVALSLGGDDDKPAPVTQPAPAPSLPPTPVPAVPATGTVTFVFEPEDAEISVEGKLVHTGSPWAGILPAGIHQIEIHKQGYKAWVTSLELSPGETHPMHIVLDKVVVDAPDDATLTITTTPAGLDVEIDGQPFADKTPIKTTLKVGAHKISVKQNGVEVWQQTVKAEAASDYELNPSFTDAKVRERAQHSSVPRPAPAPRGSAADTGSSVPPVEAPVVAPEPKPEPTAQPSGAKPPTAEPL